MSEYVRQVPTLTLQLAMQALLACLAHARQEELQVSIAIVDPAGRPIHTAHMDGAPLQSREIALNKAATAVGFGQSTTVWIERLPRCSEVVRQGLPLQANLALFGGGEPFLFEGAVIGAIGVSGASEAADVRCARAAVQAVNALFQPCG